jgi:anthranilate synthase component 2
VASLLVIDNYDSFTFNLVQMFRMYELSVKVFRSDKISLRQAEILDPDYILVSPGPKDPAHAGISIPMIRAFYQKKPVLGVCLGMQCINEAFGGVTRRAKVPVHGKTSPVTHGGGGLFKGIPSPFNVARYHSLMIVPDPSNDDIRVDAMCDGEVIMGVSHKTFPLFGVQFHPESFLTEHGFRIIENFLDHGPMAGSYTPSAGWL